MRSPAPIHACFAMLFACTAAMAQPYPNRPVTLVVNSIAGGPPDNVARAMKDEIAAALGTTIVVDNRPGAGGMSGAASVAKAEPNGYTILFSSAGPIAIAPILYKNAGFDPLRDFEYINAPAEAAVLFAFASSVPATNLKEFIALAKLNPGKYNFASGGIATPAHLAGEMLQALAGIKLVHVPHRGTPQAVAALLTGDVALFPSAAPAVVPHAIAGKIKLFAVSGEKRLKIAPDAPTAAEAGLPDLTVPAWYGILAPKGTPKPVIEKFDAAVKQAIANPVVQERLGRGAFFVMDIGSEKFAAFHRREIERWSKVIKDADIKVE